MIADSAGEVLAGASVARFKDLTERALPELARANHWPLRLDHCFKRVCLDWACGDVWYRHLPRPAEKHLRGSALARAVECAEGIASDPTGVLLRERNARSLAWRGKAGPVTHHTYRG